MSAIAGAVAMPRPKTNKWLVTVSVSFGTLMGALDTSIVNVALPHSMEPRRKSASEQR